MPSGDGTGPAGMGPMTGRAAGYCAGYSVPGFANPISGRGYGAWGRGRGGGGWGQRNRYNATGLPGRQRFSGGYPAYGGASPYGAPFVGPYSAAPTQKQELDMLKGQAEYLEDALNGINKRISELEEEAKK